MQKMEFNKGWKFKRLEEAGEGKEVTLPHDAMCGENRFGENPGGHNIGWFAGGDYVYTRKFFVPDSYQGKKVILEFEGIYRNGEVYINGRKAACRPYGYTNFYVDTEGLLKFGEENEIRVVARNGDQPNSRWYTGSGIYRPVYLYVADPLHIPPNGVKIRTLGIRPARIAVEVTTSLPGNFSVEILDAEGRRAAGAEGAAIPREKGTSMLPAEKNNAAVPSPKKNGASIWAAGKKDTAIGAVELEIPEARLWSCGQPYLYTCVVTCGTDQAREKFGIRQLAWSPGQGLTINGERVILRGACIHHDNGVLGACAFPEAEERKIRIMKENGYNAVRSAHNPCSKALLDACDRLGMLLMDEYVDVWYIHKTEYDYAGYMRDWWREDLRDMVEKDYNHPSVIMYSTGNEVSETAQKEGIALTGQMTQYLHELDSSRPVTCGVNIFFNFLSSIGFGVYSDEKAKKEAQKAAGKEGQRKKKTVGSEFYNTLAGLLGDTTMKVGATLYPCDVKTRDAYANMDIAGYNYGIFRYRHDLKKYPKRLILGSETFCKDAYRFWELAKKYPGIVGDFVWAGMDYMGEAGIGSWEYEDTVPAGADPAGWLTAGSGRVNILGFPNGEAAYTKVALEQTGEVAIAVKPVHQKGRHTPSAWKMTDAMVSWSWAGCEGMRATVEVYARAWAVELFLNGRAVGRKRLKNTCNTAFHVPYQSGILEAVAYDEKGNTIARHSLETAGSDTKLLIMPEQREIAAGGLGFIQLRYTDSKGIWKPMEKHYMRVRVENGVLLGLGNACPYNPDGYWKDTVKTHYGEALAVVRATGKEDVVITVTDEDSTYQERIRVKEKDNA